MFRPAQDLDQFLFDHQQNVLRQVASFVTAEQLGVLKKLANEDRARSEEEFAARRKGYGLTPD